MMTCIHNTTIVTERCAAQPPDWFIFNISHGIVSLHIHLCAEHGNKVSILREFIILALGVHHDSVVHLIYNTFY